MVLLFRCCLLERGFGILHFKRFLLLCHGGSHLAEMWIPLVGRRKPDLDSRSLRNKNPKYADEA